MRRSKRVTRTRPNPALQRTRPSHHCCNPRLSRAGSLSLVVRRPEGARMVVVAGIEGCPAGWPCLTKDLSTGAVQAHIRRIGRIL